MRVSESASNFTIQTAQARAALLEGKYTESYEMLRGVFDLEPKAWWLAMERIRALRRIRADTGDQGHRCRNGMHVVFSPDYTGGNGYQRNLYSTAAECGFQIHSENEFGFDGVAHLVAAGSKVVYHQHWVKELYWTEKSLEAGTAKIDRAISTMKAYKAFGAKIAWTLHNILDHDASEIQARLCRYAHERLASLADRIYVHTNESIRLLSEQCGQDLRSKCYLLDHPLYDDLTQQPGATPTSVAREIPADARVLLCFGMIRPYKGVPDLIDAFSMFRERNPKSDVMLVIAGSLHDSMVRPRISALPPKVARHLKLIPRRLNDLEVADLMSRATAAVLPYRQILISGSYYLATTFAKPVIAPARGMFVEKIENGRSGILYDGTVEGLAQTIASAMAMPEHALFEMGRLAKYAARDLSIEAISRKYFASLGALINE